MLPSKKAEPLKTSMVSIIIPVYNEVDVLDELFSRLQNLFADWKRPHEIIFIDDGSTDGSFEKLKSFCQREPSAKLLVFSRNFGQQQAVTAGFDHAGGEYILVMDADLQVYPEDIPKLVEKMDEGYDIVAGYRKNRQENNVFRKIVSRFVNYFFGRLLHLPYRDMGCGMQIFKKEILDGLDPFSVIYLHRVIFAVWRGGRFTDVPIRHDPRRIGESKYRISSLILLFLDIFVTFFTQPIQLFIFFMIGSLLSFSGLMAILILFIFKLFGYHFSISYWIIGVVVSLNGLLFISFGLINERINRINHRLNQTPLYDIREVIHFSSNLQGE